MVINVDVLVVVMIMEIFRNMFYEIFIGEVGIFLEDVEIVVFDEVYYISDWGWGIVWEELIIYCFSII